MTVSALALTPGVVIVIGLVICAAAAGIFMLCRRFVGHRTIPYFLAGVTAEQIALLNAARIQFETKTVGGRDGICFEWQKLEDICRVLRSYRLTELEIGEYKTEILLRAEQEPNAATANFTVSGASVPAIVLRLVREILLPAVGMNIVVKAPYRTVVEPIDDGQFYVIFNSVPRYSEQIVVNDMFGYRVRERALQPCRLGLPLVDEESGYVYGEVVGNCLYIHHNACTESGLQVAVLVRLLEHAARAGLNSERMLETVLASVAKDGLPDAEKQSVKQTGFTHHRRKLAVALVRGILAHAMDRPIVVHECRGNSQAGVKDADFHIFHNARPRRLKANAELPTGAGIPVTCETDLLAGELIGNALYVYDDILGYGCFEEATRFAALLLNARRQILASRLPEMIGILTSQLAGECLKEPRSRRKSETLAERVQLAEQALSGALAEARKSEHEVQRVQAMPESELAEEFDALLRVKHVLDVRVTGSKIVVETDTIFCDNPDTGNTHRLGAFHIHIPLSSDEDIKFFNQTGKIRRDGTTMHAPHVREGGSACLGNIKDMIPQLIEDREYASVVQVAIAYLESVNTNDAWGESIVEFPIERYATASRRSRR